MKKEIGQPIMIGIIVVAVILVGVFGWFKLRSTGPEVTPAQTQHDRQAQLQMMPGVGTGQQTPGQQGGR